MDEDDESIELLEEFLPVQPEKPTVPSVRQFKPWHKPRKQYMRSRQWAREVELLLPDLHFPLGSRAFRYFTLPGEEMLDIRNLGESLSNASLSLKYLGFFHTKAGSEADLRMNLSDNDMKNRSWVDDSSEVVRERVETVANLALLGYRKLLDHAPFHAINLDLCDHFVAPDKSPDQSLIQVITNIVNVQTQRSTQAWLLFVTTRIAGDYFDAKYAQAFSKAILSNSIKSEEFKELAFELLGIDNPDELEELSEKMAALETTTLRSFFCLGFGKWLLHLMCSSVPPVQVEMRPSYCYSVDTEADMLSLAYRFSPLVHGVIDSYKLTQSKTPKPKADLELNMAFRVVEQTRGILDVDKLLASQTDLLLELAAETKRLLSEAGYTDLSEYDKFFELPTVQS